MLDKAGSGHVGGAFGMADIFTTLYYNFAKIDPTNPDWDGRDYILLSNGHICPIWYAALGDLGFFDKKEFDHLRQINSLLQGHPKLGIPGIENSSGPLGHGLSQAVGICLGLKMDQKQNRVFCLVSDGEQQEGQIWEAAMAANKWKLDNLVVIMDKNDMQIEGTTDDIMPLGDLKEKYESFGWTALEIDGNNFEQILSCLEFTSKIADSPTIIIAHTKAGNGVDFIEEGHWKYHDWKGAEGEAERALAQLNEKLQTL